MSHDETAETARRLLDDQDALLPWRTFVPAVDLPPDRAYSLQAEVARLREGRGEKIIGYKIGCTSRAIQDQLGIREPIFARIFDTGCIPAASSIDHSAFANLAIEGELAIRLAVDLMPGLRAGDECEAAIASVFPVVELHHYVLPAGHHSVAALIASGGMHAGFVLPEREIADRGRVPDVVGLDVAINGERVGTTAEPWTMGGPPAVLRWLGARLAGTGLSLRRGQIILTGSPLPLYPVEPGSRVVVEALPLGHSSVTIR